MDLPRLHGIVPPLPTPLRDDETIDERALAHLVDFQVKRGRSRALDPGDDRPVRPDPRRPPATGGRGGREAAAGRVPLVLNVSDQGTERTLPRARMFDDLPYDYYAALPPWYQPMTPGEVTDYFLALGRPSWRGPWSSTTPPGSATSSASTTSGDWPSIPGSSAARTSAPA